MAVNFKVFVLTGLCLGTLPLGSFAQEDAPPPRPFRRVFGAEPSTGPAPLVLDLMVSQVLDDNILAGRLVTADPRLGTGGSYPSAGANLGYSHTGDRTDVLTSASTNFQYYPSLDGRFDQNHAASLAVTRRVGRGTTVQVSQSGAYSTYYTLLGLPGAVQPGPSAPTGGAAPTPVPGGAAGVSSESGTELHSFVAVNRPIGRRNSIGGHYGFGWTRFSAREVKTQDAGVSYSHGLGRALSLRTGYALQTASRQSDDEMVFLHNLDLGLDYSQNLPGLRSTTLSVSSGSTVIQLPTGLRYDVGGSAALTRLMGRSWTASLTYDRGAEFVAVLEDILQSDSLSVSVGGFASPRAEITLLAAYSSGHLGVRQEAETLTYNGTARVQFGLSRRFAINTEYQYFLYDFAETATIPQGLPFGESRQSVRVGALYRFAR